MKARVLVRLKSEVSDPEGAAIRDALATLHYDAVRNVRVGRVFEIDLSESDPARARDEVQKLARDVLSNPVIEEFTFDLVEDGK